MKASQRIIAAACCAVLLSATTRAQAPQQPGPSPAPQGQATAPQQPAPTQPVPPLSVLLKKTVVFITVAFQDGSQATQLQGTAFLVYVPDKRLGENRGFGYLVTNRHIAAPEINGHVVVPTPRVMLRVNRKVPTNGIQAEEGQIPLGPIQHWFLPSDDSVDLAVMPLTLDLARLDVEYFPIDLFATKDLIEKERIAEGDAVLFAGFFYQFPGQKRIEPIIRQGVLAMMPEEDVPTTRGKPGRLYFADVHVFKGNSGAPVFINLAGLRNGSLNVGVNIRLLGIVAGYFYETSDFQLEIATTVTGTSKANSGISLIIPAAELKALLESPALQKQRDDVVAAEALIPGKRQGN